MPEAQNLPLGLGAAGSSLPEQGLLQLMSGFMQPWLDYLISMKTTGLPEKATVIGESLGTQLAEIHTDCYYFRPTVRICCVAFCIPGPTPRRGQLNWLPQLLEHGPLVPGIGHHRIPLPGCANSDISTSSHTTQWMARGALAQPSFEYTSRN